MTSLTMAMNDFQGIGFSENTGSYPMPESRTGVLKIVDENNIVRILVCDAKDGKFYDVTTRTGPSSSNYERVWKDKIAYDGTGGVDIEPEVEFGEDVGETEDYFIRHLSGRYFVRPYDEENRDTTGYDSYGFLTDIDFESKVYIDGEPTTETAKAENIGRSKEVVYDREVHAHRIRNVFKASKSSFALVGREHRYLVRDVPEAPSNRLTTEEDYQSDLTDMKFWFSRGKTLNLERISGVVKDLVGTWSSVTDVIGNQEGAISINDSDEYVLGNYDTSDCVVTLWKNTVSDVTVEADTSSTGTNIDNYNGWYLQYYYFTLASSSDFKITSATNCSIFDVRCYSVSSGYSDISDRMSYYFNDIKYNNGKSVLPL